jgi:hypothetical protein
VNRVSRRAAGARLTGSSAPRLGCDAALTAPGVFETVIGVVDILVVDILVPPR